MERKGEKEKKGKKEKSKEGGERKHKMLKGESGAFRKIVDSKVNRLNDLVPLRKKKKRGGGEEKEKGKKKKKKNPDAGGYNVKQKLLSALQSGPIQRTMWRKKKKEKEKVGRQGA